MRTLLDLIEQKLKLAILNTEVSSKSIATCESFTDIGIIFKFTNFDEFEDANFRIHVTKNNTVHLLSYTSCLKELAESAVTTLKREL